MHVLLTNDDGIFAPGLASLHRVLAVLHRVSIVAPDRERSAVSHSITLHHPLRAHRISGNGDGDCPRWSVSGTPADCVKLGLAEILRPPPDLVIAGINPGENVGASIHYSGTVAAAREAALFGIPAISVSMQGHRCAHMETAARFIAFLAEHVHRRGLPFGTILNVNLPDLPADRISGVRISRQSIGRMEEAFEKRVDPRNREYYWFGPDPQQFGTDVDVDGAALENCYISITPIRCDTTDYTVLEELKDWNLTMGDAVVQTGRDGEREA
ncbi:MAG: 5'/3'-nucleotidase SurE [Desulfobacteraceae bacterium]|jgi:5'-nucleotidase|nr:5'/3'-nucleotidase SurE [Desulfobacteraceae bacterium]